jgi:putative glutamine amidotransferase
LDHFEAPTPYRPVIGIPADHAPSPDTLISHPRWLLNETYVNAVYDAGGLPLILPILPEVPDQLIEMLDGVILSGGGDIDPVHFGREQHPLASGISAERDDLELRMFRVARGAGLPILGICRGLQLINVALGGTLVQDIPDQRVGSLQHGQHLDGLARDDVSHVVRLLAGSRIAAIFGATSIMTNSYHHQAVDELADGLTVTGHAEDGTVESFEAPGEPFLVAVQWHPETLYRRHTNQALIFQAFIEAARAARLSISRPSSTFPA